MNFKEAKEIYPYITYLIEKLQKQHVKLSLNEKIKLTDEISQNLQMENEALQRRLKLRVKHAEICENLKKTYAEFYKKRPARPLMKTGVKAEAWSNFLFKEQRYLLLMKDTFSRLEELYSENLDKKGEAWHFLYKTTLPLFDRVKNSIINEHIQKVAEFLREMKKRGIPISAVDIPNVGKVRIK